MIWRSIKEQDPEPSRYYLVTINLAGKVHVEEAFYSGRWYFADRATKKWQTNIVKAKAITHLNIIDLSRVLKRICQQCKNSPEVSTFFTDEGFGNYCLECTDIVEEYKFVTVPPAS